MSPPISGTADAASSPADKSGTGIGRARILIVEDDASTRKILEKQLKIQGYATLSAENGLQGWTLANEQAPDIIISDWMMPEMDGRSLCAKIKADPRLQTAYFILLTAKDLSEDRISGLDSGADEYLIKPCDPLELLARVRAAERIISLQRALARKNDELESALSRINRELASTSAIQRSLLPQKLPSIPGYAFAACYHPSTECSGDYYDVFELGGGRFGMIMADVSGHGTPAMVAMALARSLLHHLAPLAASPADLLTRANHMLYAHLPTSQYMTAFYAICDSSTGEVQYSSAGHNPPLLVNSSSLMADYLQHCEGFPLKLVTPDAQYENHSLQLNCGETLLLYTDGIPEARDAYDRMFDTHLLRRTALDAPTASPQHLLDHIIAVLNGFRGVVPLDDDVTMLALSRT